MAVPVPYPEFGAPEGLVRGADRDGPIFPRTPWPSIGATYFATLGIAAALRARAGQWPGPARHHIAVAGRPGRVVPELAAGRGSRMRRCTGCGPSTRRSIEGLFECADGKWVHHWTLRPRWVLAAAEGDTLSPLGLDTSYRDDPDRVSMESDGLLAGIFLHAQLAEAFKKFPADEWVSAAEEAGLGITTVRPPGEALADKSFLADGCVVEVDDPERGVDSPCRARCWSSRQHRARSPGQRRVRPAHARRCSPRSNRAWEAHGPAPRPREPLAHPLAGIRVLDLGLGVAGPFTGRALADLGADVIKINALYDKYWNGTHMGLGVNRGKRSIALNLKDPDGREVLEKLLQRSDVITLNWRPGAAARLGLDYETLREPLPQAGLLQYSGVREGSAIGSAGHRPERRGDDGNGMGGRSLRCR